MLYDSSIVDILSGNTDSQNTNIVMLQFLGILKINCFYIRNHTIVRNRVIRQNFMWNVREIKIFLRLLTH